MGPQDRPGLRGRAVGEVAGRGQEGGLCPLRAASLSGCPMSWVTQIQAGFSQSQVLAKSK